MGGGGGRAVFGSGLRKSRALDLREIRKLKPLRCLMVFVAVASQARPLHSLACLISLFSIFSRLISSFDLPLVLRPRCSRHGAWSRTVATTRWRRPTEGSHM